MEQELIMSPAVQATPESGTQEVSLSQMFGVLGNPAQTTTPPSEMKMPEPKIEPVWMTNKIRKGWKVAMKAHNKWKSEG